MRLSLFDTERQSKAARKRSLDSLREYRDQVAKIAETHNSKKPEYSLFHAADPALHDVLSELSSRYKKIKHLVVVGIGGSSLGIEALHTVLGQQKVKLSVIDTIAPYEMDILQESISRYRKVSDIAVCVISKSGNTTETVTNASVLIEALKKQFGADLYQQVICIGDADTPLMTYGSKKKMATVAMPKKVGGRFSVATEVGLIPLALLGHDVDAYMAGILDASSEEFEQQAAEGAATLAYYLEKGYRNLNFFAFDKRLALLGAWYRQLYAESLGKQQTKKGKKLTVGMLPTISTAVELHSVGQLYLSGFGGVYTEFVTFDDDEHDHKIAKTGLAAAYGGRTSQEVATAIYAGVVGAYQDASLPYRSVIFDEGSLAYSLGLYMGMRMREVMYVAELLDVDAFDQPNVESYKKKTKKILKVK